MERQDHPLFMRVCDSSSACSFGLSATSQQYFSLRTNQPPVTSQQYSSLRRDQHKPSATSQPNRLHVFPPVRNQLFFFECVSSVHVLPIAMFILFVYNWHPEKEKREMLGL
jgi:hypothetical protein